MKRIVAGLALAFVLAAPAPTVTPSLEITNATPYHYGDVLAVIVHGDVPGNPGDARPKAHLRLDCDFGEGNYTRFVYSPQEETVIPVPLGYVPTGFGIANWDVAGGGPADCVLSVYATKYQRFEYTITELWDSEAFHVEG